MKNLQTFCRAICETTEGLPREALEKVWNAFKAFQGEGKSSNEDLRDIYESLVTGLTLNENVALTPVLKTETEGEAEEAESLNEAFEEIEAEGETVTKREIAVNSRAQRQYLIPRRRALFDIEIAFEEIAETLPLETWNKFLEVFDEYGRICAEEGAEEFGKEDSGILTQTLSDIFNFEGEASE